MASLLAASDSDPEAELAAEAREKRQDATVESRHLKRLASGWHKSLAVMADFVAEGERLAMRRAADCAALSSSCSGPCAAMHSAGGASSSCAAAAAASLGAAPPAAPRGVESRGFAFSAQLEILKAGSPAEKLGMARALVQDWAKRQGVGNTRETRKLLRCFGATILGRASLSQT